MRRAPSPMHPRRAQLTAMPAFTVGRRTAEAARAAGFRDGAFRRRRQGRSRRSAARDLVRTQSDTHGAPLLYLAGEDRAGDLAGDLAQPACPCAPWWSIAPSRPRAFRLMSRPRWRGARSTACCIFPRRSAEAYLDCAARGGISAERARAGALLSLPPGGGAARRRRRCRGADRGPARRGRAAGTGGSGVRGHLPFHIVMAGLDPGNPSSSRKASCEGDATRGSSPRVTPRQHPGYRSRAIRATGSGESSGRG